MPQSPVTHKGAGGLLVPGIRSDRPAGGQTVPMLYEPVKVSADITGLRVCAVCAALVLAADQARHTRFHEQQEPVAPPVEYRPFR